MMRIGILDMYARSISGLRAICMLLLATLPTIAEQISPPRLQYLGHASFEWVTAAGTRIIIDPYQNSFWSHWFDEPFPELEVDLVLTTHPHFDHNAISSIQGHAKILDEPGIYKEHDLTIKAITGHHARSHKYGSRNLVFVLEIEGIRFCHWGDNDANISDEMLEVIGSIDVLMLPVDESEHLLTMEEVSNVIERLGPKVVIPMHYLIPGLTSTCSTLLPIDNWLSRQSHVRHIPAEGIQISPDNMPREREVWVFNRVKLGHSTSRSLFLFLPCFFQSIATWAILSGILFVVLVFAYLRRHGKLPYKGLPFTRNR